MSRKYTLKNYAVHKKSRRHRSEWNFKLLFESFLDEDCFSFFCGSTAKHFHRRSVSSAAADTTVLPSGDIAMCNTRDVWPAAQIQQQFFKDKN